MTVFLAIKKKRLSEDSRFLVGIFHLRKSLSRTMASWGDAGLMISRRFDIPARVLRRALRWFSTRNRSRCRRAAVFVAAACQHICVVCRTRDADCGHYLCEEAAAFQWNDRAADVVRPHATRDPLPPRNAARELENASCRAHGHRERRSRRGLCAARRAAPGASRQGSRGGRSTRARS